MLAACAAVVVATPLLGAAPANADSVSSLMALRQQLQQQVAGLGGIKAQALSDLLLAENALKNNQAELEHNAGVLAALRQQQDATRAKIDATRKEIETQRRLLGDLTRGQYKHLSTDDSLSLIFSSNNFGQLVNQVMAGQGINRRISDTARKLKADENALTGLSAQLAAKQSQSLQVQSQLEQENGRQLALVADHDARLAQIDGQSRALLDQIAGVNSRITAAQAPPPTRFSSGSGPGGSGGSCGNHFYYGYCTWYVANRRCIPWFGNAWEWYGRPGRPDTRWAARPASVRSRCGAPAWVAAPATWPTSRACSPTASPSPR